MTEVRLNEMIKEDEMLLLGPRSEVKVKGKRKLSHFADSPGSQTLMMVQLDPKRKRSMQLASDYPATHVNLKAPTLLLAPRSVFLFFKTLNVSDSSI